MSDNLPPEPAAQPEFLGQGKPERRGRSRTKLGVTAGVGVVAAGAVAAGAWGVAQLLGGGPGAASVLPDTVLAYASVDLDPSAGQKIEAIKTIKKFPALDDELGMDADDDLRRWLVDKLREEEDCDLDYDSDIEPWIGDKAAVAAVPSEEHVADAVFAVQVTDQAKAEDGIRALFSTCGDTDEYGLAFLDDYVIVAETDEIASATVEAAQKASLADSDGYGKALDAVGEIGVATFYVAPGAPQALFDGFLGSMGSDDSPDSSQNQIDKALENFTGAAGTVRFDGGGVELAVAAGGVNTITGAATTTIADLPASTVLALGFALPDNWLETVENQVRSGMGEEFYQQLLAEAEAETGLELPEDLEALVGDGLVLALDGDTDFEALFGSGDFTSLKAGIRVDGASGDVREVLDALLLAAFGDPAAADIIKVQESGDRVAVGFDDDYLGALLEGGDLGDDERFQDAVPEASRASGAFYVDFDAADNWLERVAGDLSDNDPEVVDNVAPLSALGVSGWNEGDTTHLVLRLSTD